MITTRSGDELYWKGDIAADDAERLRALLATPKLNTKGFFCQNDSRASTERPPEGWAARPNGRG